MPKLDLTRARQIKGPVGDIRALKGPGYAWTRPDQFPVLGGEFVHYREEDVTEAGATAAHGLPLHMELIGAINRIATGGVDYLSGAHGVLDVVREPWPADTGFTIWMLHDGSRVANALYNGPEIYTTGADSLAFSTSGSVVGSGGRIPNWTLPAAVGPETIAYHRPAGSSVPLRNLRCRHNGVDMGTPTGSNIGNNTYSSGTTFTIGGRRDPSGGIQHGNVRWRDVVLLIGRDFTAGEIAALETYARKRARGAA